MARIRFTTARDVFEAFPTAREDIRVPATDDAPQAFLRALAASRTPEDALAFCAYLLPRREAVWWACQCVRALLPAPGEEDEAALRAAEDWVREPEEPRRRAALERGMQGGRKSAAAWTALAAAWSGGSMVVGEHGAVPAPPHLTAKAARAAVLMALAHVGAAERAHRIRACIEGGLGLVGRDALPA